MLKMMLAFSYAREYCDVGLCVKASNLYLSTYACGNYSPQHTM